MKSFFSKLPRLLIATVAIEIISACSPTRMVDYWQADDFRKDALDQVLIVAVTSNKTHRILFEDGLMSALKNEGITAYTSHTLLKNDMPTKEEVIAYVNSHNIKYVMATKVDNVQTNTDYVPPAAVTYITGPYYWSGGNTTTLTREEFTDRQTIVWLVTSIYDAKTQAMVWQGHSRTFEINSVSTVGADIAKSTLKSLSN